MNQQQYKMSQPKQQVELAHNGQNNHNQRRSSKVPVRELPEDMPKYQHSVYPQLYCVEEPKKLDYKWDCIILDLDRTIIHGKRLSVKRWRKYVENGTIPSLAENQCSKWHRHIHRSGHQMHPFIRGRTMIYYRPFTWHLLAVLDYLKSHFNTKIIVCTKAGEHYAASVLAALISNFTSANPDLIDDVYNFHDLHDDESDEGKPKKPFRLICQRHNLDPKKTLIVDDNATSWFDADRKITNFWMPPCYGYQIHNIDNELQLLCKYLWDPIQQNHLKKKAAHKKQQAAQPPAKPVEDSTDSSVSPRGSPKREIASGSPKSLSPHSHSTSSKYYLNSPQHKTGAVSPTYSMISNGTDHTIISSAEEDDHKVGMSRISHSYNKRRYTSNGVEIPQFESRSASTSTGGRGTSNSRGSSNEQSQIQAQGQQTKTQTKATVAPTKTKKKYGFFESKSRGSKKLAKMIGK